MTKKKTWYEKLQSKVGDTDKAIGASKHARGKRKPKGWRQARKKRQKQARAMRRRNRSG